MGAGRLVVETVEWRFSGDPEPFAVWHCLMRADPGRWGDRFVRRLSEDEAKALMKELGQEGEVNG